MGFLLQRPCLASFRETELRIVEGQEAVKSTTDSPLEVKVILSPPPITSKNTVLLLLSTACSFNRFLSHSTV